MSRAIKVIGSGALAGALLTLATTASGAGPRPLPQARASTFTLTGIEISVDSDSGPFMLSTTTSTIEPGVEVATLRLDSEQPARPPRMRLDWSIPAHDVHGRWTTNARFDKALGPDWGPSRVESMLSRNAPVFTLFGADDENRLTFAVSDPLNAVNLTAGVREEDARVYGGIELFVEPHRAVREIEIEVRFDRRAVPFWVALNEVADWWAMRPGFEPAPVPESAREPMYSTWYSYHQSIDAAALLREVEIGRGLGLEAIIVDDGWQTLDSNRGYAYTGDWQPERIPGMKSFVDAVHERGMKILLWYSLPLVGERSQTYPRFVGKYLRYWDGQGAYVLDPRYPEVREHIIETYGRAMREWGVDGFKLDFLGFLTASDDTELTVADGRDYASVNEATDRLMTDIMARLRAQHPDVMIEFRQPYIGPLMRKYGNMFRAGDSPNAAVDNRVRTVDLRLTSGATAVHSDMFMWHYEEPVETAALQILDILFAVPQLSVRLEDIPADHREMVTFWIDYWRRNRGVLLDGTFEPRQPLANYPLVAAQSGGKRIVAAYQDVVVDIDPALETVDVVNAKASARIVVDSPRDLGDYTYTTSDTRGRRIERGVVTLSAGAHTFSVPPAGLLTLERAR
ncbi:MAG: alpha-galactosidase [Acidobacteriota bacterium]|jgi:alpha-galactosidase